LCGFVGVSDTPRLKCCSSIDGGFSHHFEDLEWRGLQLTHKIIAPFHFRLYDEIKTSFERGHNMGNMGDLKVGADAFPHHHDRRNPRNPYKENLKITVSSKPHGRTLLAISSNISDDGICIYTFKRLEEGQDIVFKNALPVPHRKATVRWVKKINPSIYKTGVLLSS
jgi:hypothetical protein